MVLWLSTLGYWDGDCSVVYGTSAVDVDGVFLFGVVHVAWFPFAHVVGCVVFIASCY